MTHESEPAVPIRPAILLIEDQRATRSSMKSWLVSALPQFTLLEVDSAEAALLLLDQVIPRPVVLEIRLPGTDRFQATRIIKTKIVQAMWSCFPFTMQLLTGRHRSRRVLLLLFPNHSCMPK